MVRVKHRFLSKPIASNYDSLAPLVKDREAEHAAQFFYKFITNIFVEMHDHFRI